MLAPKRESGDVWRRQRIIEFGIGEGLPEVVNGTTTDLSPLSGAKLTICARSEYFRF
jgi:hypothetical protein